MVLGQRCSGVTMVVGVCGGRGGEEVSDLAEALGVGCHPRKIRNAHFQVPGQMHLLKPNIRGF